MMDPATNKSGGVVVGSEKENEVILPPPTPLNPVPSLPVALRIDNEEQLLSLLKTDPFQSKGGATTTTTGMMTESSSFRQLLVFGTESLRTLLMRQVLSNPHTRTFTNKKKNWDSHNSFPLPKGLSLVGTRILSNAMHTEGIRTSTDTTAEGSAEVSLKGQSSWEDAIIDVDVVTYFLRASDLSQTQNVIKRIKSWKKTTKTHHRIVYLPQPTALVHKMIHSTGLAANPNVSVHRLQLDIFPLEADLYSLEYDDAMKEAQSEGTPSTLVATVARSILKLQDVVGTIPRIQSLGPLGEDVVRKMLNLTVDEYLVAPNQEEAHPGPVAGGDVAALLVLDRRVDYITPMTTPLTYEGLMDELVGIDCGFIKVDINTINPEDDDAAEKKQKEKTDEEIVALGVNGSDSLFAEVRDQHVEKFGIFLQNQAKALRESHQNFTSKGKNRDLTEIHQFVKQIPVFTQNLRSLTNHIHLAELVKAFSEEATFRERWQTERSMIEGESCYDFLEDLVACQYPPIRFFRLMCLQSLCAGGIKSSRYDALRRDIVQTYGYEYLFVLRNLEKIGVLRRRETLWMDSTSPFNSLRKSLILINAEVNTVEPDDVSYVSSGYAPLSVRLVQAAVQGWRGKEDTVLKELPGRLVDVTQHYPPEDLSTAVKRPKGPSLGNLAADRGAGTTRKPTLMIMFVGGVTHMEIAALRYLSNRPKFPYHIICVTTKVINGSTLLRSLSSTS
ncbi:protein sorting-associated protein 33A [Seminavis robusta]|uniref:Protein sorting-associated protein 33A n=1 Tax=Seminavis robusta TaxID=568900 RepID=A0A9N8H322_9STRA|nr:protein sorting-associated protein 33A [Seminavis robusta]|eukprot:Sro78_g042480.1 protein sorting-associated protein 33A (727) ;mRNA; r:77242-79655